VEGPSYPYPDEDAEGPVEGPSYPFADEDALLGLTEAGFHHGLGVGFTALYDDLELVVVVTGRSRVHKLLVTYGS
jgi:hypothetical protein